MNDFSTSGTNRRRHLPNTPALIRIALMAVVICVYLPVLDNGFIAFDDPDYVTENRHVRQGLTWQGIGWAMTSFHAANWHPLTWVSHMLDVTLFGFNPAGHHLTSLILHLLNTLLLYGLLRSMTGAALRSGMVAALFAVHPLHVESVAWIAERKDVLCTAMALAALGCYLRYVRRPGIWAYLAVAAFFTLALMAKPMAVTLPFVMVILDVWPLQRFGPIFRSPSGSGSVSVSGSVFCPGFTIDTDTNPEKAYGFRRVLFGVGMIEKLPFVFMALGSGLITLAAQFKAGAIGPLAVYPLCLRLANALWSYLAYIAKAIVPLNLAVYYPYDSRWMGLKVGLALVTLGALTWLAWTMRRPKPYLLAGWLWYLVTLLPVIGLVQVGAQAMADRYTYLPLTGLFVAGVWLAADWAAAHRTAPMIRWGLCLAVAGVLMAGARSQVLAWKDTVTLFTQALQATDNNALAHNTLGQALYQGGRPDLAGPHFLRAIAIEPAYGEAHLNLGNLYLDRNRLDEAMACYEKARAVRPGAVRAIHNIGLIHERRGQTDQAKTRYEEALRHQSSFTAARTALAGLLERQGHYGMALAQSHLALATDPTDARAHFVQAVVWDKTGQRHRARQAYEQALKWDPNLAEAHTNLGNLLLNQGLTGQAIVHFDKVVALAPLTAQSHINLATALLAAGHLDRALVHGREALRLAPRSAQAHNAMGVIALRLGKVPAAIARWRQALNLDPTDKDARQNIEQVLQQRPQEGQGDPNTDCQVN